jgi:Sulfotransferase domain
MEALDTRHIVCAGMYRACSTWQYEVVNHLLSAWASGTLVQLGYMEGPEYQLWVQSTGASAKLTAVFKCHDRHGEFNRAIKRGELRVVYAYRDLRDVVDSMRHKMGMPLDKLIHQGLIPRILSNDRYWSAQPGVIIQRYEDIIVDPSLAVTQLAKWLGLNIKENEAQAIAEEYSLEANRKRTAVLSPIPAYSGEGSASLSQNERYDPATLLHWNHLRQGRSGGWRVSFTAEELAEIHHQAGSWLIDRGYENNHAWLPASRRKGIRTVLNSIRAHWAAFVYFTARHHPRLARVIRQAIGWDTHWSISTGTIETKAEDVTRIA